MTALGVKPAPLAFTQVMEYVEGDPSFFRREMSKLIVEGLVRKVIHFHGETLHWQIPASLFEPDSKKHVRGDLKLVAKKMKAH